MTSEQRRTEVKLVLHEYGSCTIKDVAAVLHIGSYDAMVVLSELVASGHVVRTYAQGRYYFTLVH